MNSSSIKSITEAQHASQSGHYECCVLHSFRYHWQQQQTFERWLDYMIFKRQLGYPLSSAHLKLAQQWSKKNWLQRWRHKLYGHRARQLKNLVDEAKGNSANPAVKKPKQHGYFGKASQPRGWWCRPRERRTPLDRIPLALTGRRMAPWLTAPSFY